MIIRSSRAVLTDGHLGQCDREEKPHVLLVERLARTQGSAPCVVFCCRCCVTGDGCGPVVRAIAERMK